MGSTDARPHALPFGSVCVCLSESISHTQLLVSTTVQTLRMERFRIQCFYRKTHNKGWKCAFLMAISFGNCFPEVKVISDIQVPVMGNVILTDFVQIYQNGILVCNFSLPFVNTKLTLFPFIKITLYMPVASVQMKGSTALPPMLFIALSANLRLKAWILKPSCPTY